MYCTRCGNQTGELDKFCSQCGNLAPSSTAAFSTQSTFTATLPPQPSSGYVSGPAPMLTRSLRNRKIAGVCAGIARHFGVDPTVVRVLFLAMFFCPVLPAIIPYIVCWVIMPLERPEPVYQPAFYPAHQPLTPMAR